MKVPVVALVSGGIDSVAMLYRCTKTHKVIVALSFDYGSKHNSKEIPFAALHSRKLGIPHKLIKLPFIARLYKSTLLKGGGAIPEGHYKSRTMKKTVVPFRNGIFLAVAGGLAESARAKAVIIGAHAGDHAIYPDCREAFMKSMTKALELGTYDNIRVLRPFIKYTKAEIVAQGHHLGIDFKKTWSCYTGGTEHCGACGTCVERREAFIISRIPDPTIYLAEPPLPLNW